jgi:hypothetical protein
LRPRRSSLAIIKIARFFLAAASASCNAGLWFFFRFLFPNTRQVSGNFAALQNDVRTLFAHLILTRFFLAGRLKLDNRQWLFHTSIFIIFVYLAKREVFLFQIFTNTFKHYKLLLLWELNLAQT